jgi:hypothetical protein
MADDNSARYRSNDSFDREPATPATDPLAELARLIGRNDPFSEYGRAARPAVPTPPPAPDPGARYGTNSSPPQPHNEPVQPYAHEPAAHQPAAYQPAEPAPRYSPEPAPPYRHDAAPRYAADYPPRAYDDQAGPDDWPVPAPPPAPAHPSNESFAQPQPPYRPQHAPHHDNTGYATPNLGSPSYTERPARDGYPPDLPGFGPPVYAGAPDRQNYPPLYPHEPEAGAMPAPHDDEFYDDEPRGGRRKGLLTVIAVLGLAVLGTAGAFAYRSMFSGPASSGPVPVIRASGEPSKVAPPPPTADQSQSAGKFSYDRFGDAGKDEQVVRREEKPVDLSKVAPPPAPRTVFPGAPVASPPSAKSAGGAAMSAANPPSAIGEPRRVRTVPIRPDQASDVAAAPPSQQPPSQQPASVAPPRQVNAAAANAAAAPPDETTPQRAAAARASSRTAMRSTPPPAPASNAPLSLSPDANNNPSQPVAQDNFPPPPPRASAPPPARVASAPQPAASAGGSYLVQVSSQRSEAEAENAYRGIQSKFGSVLGSQPHTVRRADLGAKGVYYRAMVGPFASREEAVQVCSSLKQAGGDCVVQH